MIRACPAARAFLLVLTTVALALSAGPSEGQDGFRITYDVDRTSRPGKVQVVGRVANDGLRDVFEVNVTAEALDGRGKVLARGITYVDSKIARGDSRPFVTVVPDVPGVVRFRVAVSSYRSGLGGESP
jgi:hypothetical protein